MLDLTEADLRPFRVGRDSLSPLGGAAAARRAAANRPEPPKASATAVPSRNRAAAGRTQRLGTVSRLGSPAESLLRSPLIPRYGSFATFAPSPCSRSTSRP